VTDDRSCDVAWVGADVPRVPLLTLDQGLDGSQVCSDVPRVALVTGEMVSTSSMPTLMCRESRC
jgi:hypothetical protein